MNPFDVKSATSKTHRIAIFVFLLLPSILSAQSTNATVTGFVTDQSKAAMADVKIDVINMDTNVHHPTKSNAEGSYTAPDLPPGTYKMELEKQGFKSIVKPEIILHVQDVVAINFTMAVGSTSESVTVEGGAPMINTTDASVSTVVDRQFVENIPLNGRSFQSLETLAPGTAQVPAQSSLVGRSGEIVVNGQRTEANYFTVDGVSVNTGTSPNGSIVGAGYAGATPGETILGTTQSMVSIDALEEFRVSTSSYSAEYGRTPGGQFSFSTRAGTNISHGSLFDYLRNDALDANNWFNTASVPSVPKQAEKQNDFGGTFSGPIVIPGLYNGRNKTFFFFSYEGLRLTAPQPASLYYVPDATMRQMAAANPAAAPLMPFLNAFPLPNRGEDGFNDGLGLYSLAYSSPSSLDSTSLRIDHNFGDKTRVFVRYADTPSNSWTYPYPAIKASLSRTMRSLTAGITSSITPAQANELRFNLTQHGATQAWTSTNFGGAAAFAGNTVPGPGGQPLGGLGATLDFELLFGGGFALYDVGTNTASQRQYNIVDTYSWSHGAHHFRFGVDWRRLTTYTHPVAVSETGAFSSESSVLTNTAGAVYYNQGASTVVPLFHTFSTFLQDEWKIAPRLSLSLGLRWEINPAPGNLVGPSPYTVDQVSNLATSRLAPPNTPLWRTDWKAFAPRLGIAYRLRQAPDHEMVLRTGFGIFYDTGNLTGVEGLNGAVGFSSSGTLAAAAFPLSSTQWSAIPPPNTTAPYSATVYAFDHNLRLLPYTMQWNVAIEQGVGQHQTTSVTYVGAGGRRLPAEFYYEPNALGNPNFTSSGLLYVTSNRASSSYESLQLKYQATMLHNLNFLLMYTLSHSIDNASQNFRINQLVRSSSDFDIRHNVQGAITYNIPGHYVGKAVSSLLTGWGIDSRISARSALPLNLVGRTGLDPASLQFTYYSPDVVPGQPTYIYGPYPGGREINLNAFARLPVGIQGDAGRNSLRNLGEWQVDAALRRDFPIGERLKLQFRAEAFNVLNHPNFGPFYNFLSGGPTYFGKATGTLDTSLGVLNSLYQTGGPRSLQLSLKLMF